MDCPACRADNREGARFCRSCGSALAQTPPVAAAGEPLLEIEAEGQVPAADAPVQPVPVPEKDLQEPLAESGAPGLEPPTDEAEARGEEMEDVGTAHEEARDDEPLPLPESPSAEIAQAPAADVGAMPHRESATETGSEAIEGTAGQDLEDEKAFHAPGEESLPDLDKEEELLAFWREAEEPLVSAPPGTLIAERYVIAQVLDAQEDQILYVAHDLGQCWQCGFEGNDPEEVFCANCGASLEKKAEVHLLEVRDAQVQPASGQRVAARLEHEGRLFLLLDKMPAAPQDLAAPQEVQFVFGQRSDLGQVRGLNEDSMLALTLFSTYQSWTAPARGLFAVADGMGGHEGGEVASKLALEVLAAQMVRAVILPGLRGQVTLEDDILVHLRQAIIAANDAVYLARQKTGSDMGTTLTALFLCDDRLFLAHVGDCRAYRWNADGLEQLTTDHSVVASMIAEGTATPEEIYTHPHRSVIYRCIGDRPLVEVDTDILPLNPEDRLVVCSDGLWEMIRNEGIEDALMLKVDPQAACDLMVQQANAAGGDDNISVIVVQVRALI